MDKEIKDAIKLLRNNGYIVKELTTQQEKDCKQCEEMSENGEDMECFECACSICICQ
jgi:hypothetical protein